MSEKLIPGSYQGKIVDCDSGAVGANNTPLVKIYFDVEGKRVAWSGWITDTVIEKTGLTLAETNIAKLIDLGFDGKCLSELSSPEKDIQKLLDTNKEWTLEVAFQVKENVITEYLEVKWFNDPSRIGTTKLSYADAVQTFKGMNLGGMISQAKKKTPARVEKEVVEKEYAKNDVTLEDIPF